MAESFDQIRASASGNAAILLRMLEAIETIATLTGAGAASTDYIHAVRQGHV